MAFFISYLDQSALTRRDDGEHRVNCLPDQVVYGKNAVRLGAMATVGSCHLATELSDHAVIGHNIMHLRHGNMTGKNSIRSTIQLLCSCDPQSHDV